MMVKDFKPLIELQHIHMDTSNEKACEAKFSPGHVDLTLVAVLTEVPWPQYFGIYDVQFTSGD